MSDEMELLREFRADVPAPTEETRQRIHDYATQAARRRASLPGRLTALVPRVDRWRLATPPSRGLRWGIALVALALASGGAAIALTTPASGGQGVNDLLSQVQQSFGDSLLLSASVNGSTLTVNVAAPDEPSAVRATFEAQILASAVHDAATSAQQTPINSVQFLDASGNAIPGYSPAPVASDASLATLSSGACMSAAQPLQTSTLTIQSALTLPYAGGACAFKFQASTPSSFNAPFDVAKLVDAMGDPNQRSYLVEVDDQAGVPLFIYNYTPSGGGVDYVKPGSNILFGP